MSDPFAAPEIEDAIHVGGLPIWVRLSQGTLCFVSLSYGLMALGLTPLMAAMPFFDPELAHEPEELKWGISLTMAAISVVCLGGYALVPLIAALGLQRRALWGWVLALILGAMLTPSACLPFGALILVGILHPEGRVVYLK